MKPPKYTDTDIIAAGKFLIDQNKNVTPNAIKSQLGGGNPSRIKKVWDEYRNDSGATNSGGSRLNEPLNPDDSFAFAINRHVQNAASQVEGVFIKLLDNMKADTEKRFAEILDRQENEYAYKIGEIKAELKLAKREIEYWKESREEVFGCLMERTKENEALSASVESLTRQIEELKNKQSS